MSNENYDLRKNEKFLRQLYNQAPLSIWASLGKRDNYKIVFWNEGAELIYGISAKEAIGSNYLDLFVADEDPQIRQDSENDCNDIIDKDKKFVNYLAVDLKRKDSIKSDEKILLLTNVFRVMVENQGYQVEMAVDITSSGLLEFRKADFRQLTQVVKQIEKEVQLTTYENIDTISDINKLENLILQALIDLTGAEEAGLITADYSLNNLMTVKKIVPSISEHNFEDLNYPKSSISTLYKNKVEIPVNSNGEIIIDQESKLNNLYYISPISSHAGYVILYHKKEGFFDTHKKEAVKSFLSRVSGLYEVSTKFDFNRNWRVALAHEFLSHSDKVNKALQEYISCNPEAKDDEDLNLLAHANQLQLDLAANIVSVGKKIDSSNSRNSFFVNILTCIDSAIFSQQPSINLKNQLISITYLTPKEVLEKCELVGTVDVVERILRVLLHNSTKYSPSGSIISLSVSVEREYILTKMKNLGCISPEILVNAFEASPPISHRTNKDGAHVGLHVSRNLARSFDGDILLENESDTSMVVSTLKWLIRSS